jgi:hypothetical protein
MPIVPNVVERVAFSLNKAPGILLDLLGATAFRSAIVALDLGIFEFLKGGGHSAKQLALHMNRNEDALFRLLEYLVATGYLRVNQKVYFNSSQTSKWLLADAPGNFVDVMKLWGEQLLDVWTDNLESTLQNGKPRLHLHEWLSQRPARWQTFNSAMASIAHAPAKEIARRLKFKKRMSQLLDVGGNHGLYSSALCKRYSNMRATIFDLPDALKQCDVQNSSQIRLLPGDVLKDDLGSGYDVVLISNLLHYFDAATCKIIVAKAAAALVPGGLLIINEHFSNSGSGRTANAGIRLVSLHYLLFLGGDAHPLIAASTWLTDSSCRLVRRLKLRSVPGQTVLVGRKSSG